MKKKNKERRYEWKRTYSNERFVYYVREWEEFDNDTTKGCKVYWLEDRSRWDLKEYFLY